MNQPSKLRSGQRAILLQHGGLTGRNNGKTGLSLLRYSEAEVVAVIDEDSPGGSLAALTRMRFDREIPIVRSVAEALAHRPDVLSIGIAPTGGRLPEAWLEEIRTAVRHGVCIQNGLHTRLNEDPVIRSSLGPGQWVWDMRQEPPGLSVGSGAARGLACRRVLFVGTDMNVGKMTAALELDRAARRRGLRSKFIATGQTGMMIAGDGVALDGVRVDYASGAIEHQMMLHGPGNDLLFVEGQGSLLNPASTATLPLIRGTQPTHLILVHRAGMTHLKNFPHIAVPPLRDVVRLNEDVARGAGAFAPARVVGIALNSWDLTEEEARAEAARVEGETGLPCADVIRGGADTLLAPILG
ncbi:MAG TPA: DUF1611 domain-containing protein [Verrucomicrobiales bacterium]|nr:DUF1611 domain-containing protein [Verrucomicrobiales bacterium]